MIRKQIEQRLFLLIVHQFTFAISSDQQLLKIEIHKWYALGTDSHLRFGIFFFNLICMKWKSIESSIWYGRAPHRIQWNDVKGTSMHKNTFSSFFRVWFDSFESWTNWKPLSFASEKTRKEFVRVRCDRIKIANVACNMCQHVSFDYRYYHGLWFEPQDRRHCCCLCKISPKCMFLHLYFGSWCVTDSWQSM